MRQKCLARESVTDQPKMNPASGHLMSKENALLQEAINTALAFHEDTTVRGACYSCERIVAFLRVVRQKSGQ